MSLEDVSSWRLSTPGGIPFRVIDRSGSFGEEDSEATETYIIEANNLLAFVVEGFPAPYILGGTVFYPLRTPMGGFPALSVKRITWKGFVDGLPVDPFGADVDPPAGTYQDFLEVQVTFGTTPQNDTERNPYDPLTFLEITANASGEFLVSPVRGEAGSALWIIPPASSTLEVREIDVGQPINQVLIEWNVRWAQIPFGWFNSTLMSRLRDAMGKVNSTAMPIFNDAPPETIMFLGFSMSNQYTWRDGNTGASPVALDMKFLEKNFEREEGAFLTQVTHNHMYRPGSGWLRLEINGDKLYTEFDLNTIFSP